MSERMGITWRIVAYGFAGLVLALVGVIYGKLDACATDLDKRVGTLESHQGADEVRWEFVKSTLQEVSDDLKKHMQEQKR